LHVIKATRIARFGLAVAAMVALPAMALAHSDSPNCAPASQGIPPRAASAPAGAEFARQVAALSERDRDAAIRDALLGGNLPQFLRSAVPIELIGRVIDGVVTRVTLCVLPDYLSVGTTRDSLLVPMGLDTALAVAEALGFVLPTRRMVDAIYQQAVVRLSPQPLPPGDRMRSTGYYVRHNELVQAQRSSAAAQPAALTAGHKKDLIITKQLWGTPGRVAIYGWHRSANAPIQPLSTVHGARYADYSHGVRLVSTTAFVDGKPTSIFDLMRDDRFATLLSDEGPFNGLPDALRSLAGNGATVFASLRAGH
jgi:hypothetical protein